MPPDTFEAAKQSFLEGLRLLQAGNLPAAETQFARSLELVPDRVSTLNNLSAVKIRLKKFSEGEDLAKKTISLQDHSSEAWSNLGMALTGMKRHDEALPAYDRAFSYNPANPWARFNQALTLFELKRFDEALAACEQALTLKPQQYEFLYTQSLILKELDQPADAKKIYLKSLEMRAASSPVTVLERRATQKADVLIISRNPVIDNSLKSFETLHQECENFPGQIVQRFQDDFRFAFIFEGEAIKPSARKKIPQPDLIINNFTNGEVLLSSGSLPGLLEFVDSFVVPVVNHPAKAIQTTRDMSARLLADVPGIRVPKTMRFSWAGKTHDEVVHEIEQEYDYPLITRTLAMQNGKGMFRADSPQALHHALAAGLPENFFITEFIDNRGINKFFRKIRAAIVKDEIFIIRVDYSDHWNVRGRRNAVRRAFYLENMYVLEEEKRICAHPEEELGRSAMQALQAIRDRIPLDVFGVDLDVNADGMLVFYEANATMNLFSTAQKEIPNPEEADERLHRALRNYLMSLAARP